MGYEQKTCAKERRTIIENKEQNSADRHDQESQTLRRFWAHTPRSSIFPTLANTVVQKSGYKRFFSKVLYSRKCPSLGSHSPQLWLTSILISSLHYRVPQGSGKIQQVPPVNGGHRGTSRDYFLEVCRKQAVKTYFAVLYLIGQCSISRIVQKYNTFHIQGILLEMNN